MTVVPSLPLTSVSTEALKAAMIARIQTYFPDWSDRADSNSMIALIEAICAQGELMYAYINKMARESFIQYAIDPRNVDALARGLGYTPTYATPAVVEAYLTTPALVTANTTVPMGATFATALPGITYELVADAVILQNHNSVGPVQLKQQVSRIQEFTPTTEAAQTVVLDYASVIPDTIAVYIDGIAWTYVEHFVDSIPTDQVFTYRVSTSDYSVVLIFGDGQCGQIPSLGGGEGSAARVEYKTGGGKIGTIPSHYLRQCITEVRDGGTNAIVSVSGDNDLPAIPGGDPETTAQIKKHAAAYTRAPRVLYDLVDVESAVEAIPGVLACKAVNWEILPSLPHYLVEIFLLTDSVSEGNIIVSPALEEAVINLLSTTRPLVMGMTPMVAPAIFKDLNFNFQLFVKDGYSLLAVKQSVTNMINDLFDITKTNIWNFVPSFGMPIYSSQLIAILQSIDGVRNLVMFSPTDTALQVNEFPRVNSVTFVD